MGRQPWSSHAAADQYLGDPWISPTAWLPAFPPVSRCAPRRPISRGSGPSSWTILNTPGSGAGWSPRRDRCVEAAARHSKDHHDLMDDVGHAAGRIWPTRSPARCRRVGIRIPGNHEEHQIFRTTARSWVNRTSSAFRGRGRGRALDHLLGTTQATAGTTARDQRSRPSYLLTTVEFNRHQPSHGRPSAANHAALHAEAAGHPPPYRRHAAFGFGVHHASPANFCPGGTCGLQHTVPHPSLCVCHRLDCSPVQAMTG